MKDSLNSINISPVSGQEILLREIFFGGKLQNEALSLEALKKSSH